MTTIPGATSQTYTMTAADVGQNITCTVIGTNSAGSANGTSNSLGPVTAAGGGTTSGWSPLKIGNGGLLSGINIAPDGSMAVRTDSYGAYVWDAPTDKWYPLLDQTGVPTGTWTGALGDGVDEIVFDPQNSNTIWMQWNGNLYKSTNKGRAFTLTDFPNQSYPHMNNGDTRTQGPFMAVDPVNSNIVYASTPARGIYRTTNGTNFTQMANFAGGLPSQVQFPPPRVYGTDTTSVVVGTGSKSFNNNSAGFNFGVGLYVKIWRTSDRMVQFFGTVTASSGTTFTLNVDTAFGSGTFTDWSIGMPFQFGGGNSGVCAGHRILFVPDGQTTTAFGQTVSKNVYVHTHGVNTWKSTDGGVTWTALPITGTFIDSDGPPTKAVRRWTADPFGVVWVCGDNYATWDNLYKFDPALTGNEWKQLDAALGHPSYDAVMVDLNNSPSKALTTAIFIADSKFIVVYTKDGGATTTGYGDITNRLMSTPANDVLWFQDQYDHDQTHSIPVCDAKMDPMVPGRIWVAGEGCYYFSYSRSSAIPIQLTQQSRGVEEFIPSQVFATATQNYWFTVWDFPLFQSTDPAVFPSKIQGTLGGAQTVLTIGYSFDWQPGGLMCAVISDSSGNTIRSAAEGTGYSTNGGVTWTKFTIQPHQAFIDGSGRPPGGSMAMADADTYVYVHAHNEQLPRETTNGRSATPTWTDIAIPGGTPVNGWGIFLSYAPDCRPIESDKTNGDIYLYNINRAGSFGTGDAIYKRTKSTGLWSLKQSNPGISGGMFTRKIKHVFGQTGHFFFCSGENGSHPFTFTNDGWTTFNDVNVNFTIVSCMGFCAPYPGQSYPGILALGIYSGVFGYYLCKDFNPATRAGTWVLQTYPQGPLIAPKDLCGDPGITGRFVAFTTGGAVISNLP